MGGVEVGFRKKTKWGGVDGGVRDKAARRLRCAKFDLVTVALLNLGGCTAFLDAVKDFLGV